MRGLPLPGCSSVVPVSRSFVKIIKTVQMTSLLWKLIFSTLGFQYMQVMYQNSIFFTVKHDELTQKIYVVVCYHANKKNAGYLCFSLQLI